MLSTLVLLPVLVLLASIPFYAMSKLGELEPQKGGGRERRLLILNVEKVLRNKRDAEVTSMVFPNVAWRA